MEIKKKNLWNRLTFSRLHFQPHSTDAFDSSSVHNSSTKEKKKLFNRFKIKCDIIKCKERGRVTATERFNPAQKPLATWLEKKKNTRINKQTIDQYFNDQTVEESWLVWKFHMNAVFFFWIGPRNTILPHTHETLSVFCVCVCVKSVSFDYATPRYGNALRFILFSIWFASLSILLHTCKHRDTYDVNVWKIANVIAIRRV